MNKFWIIVSQVYKKNVKSVGFITMILSPIILLGVIAAIIYFVSDMESEVPEVALVTEIEEVRTAFSENDELFLLQPDITTIEEAEEAIGEETIDGYVMVTNEENILHARYYFVSGSPSLNEQSLGIVLSSLQTTVRANELDLSMEEVQSLMTPPVIESTTVSIEDGDVVEGDQSERDIKIGAAYVVCIAIFMFIMTYASIIADEIASEKGTRIMEVILSSVSATVHFFGKLTAILLICLTQIAFYGIVFAVASQFEVVQSLIPQGMDITAILQGVLGAALFYFIAGIILFAVLAAFLGSMVTKVEDVSKAVSPIVFTALIGFYGGLFAMISTTHPIVKIGSFVPFFAPFIMPFRIATDSVSGTEVMISMVIMVVFTAFVSYFALILYRSNVLIYSESTMLNKIKTSWANARSERRLAEGK